MILTGVKCKTDPNKCYICGKHILPSRHAKLAQFVKKACYSYFELKLSDQDKAFAPHMCCKTCVKSLGLWSVRKIKSLFLVLLWYGEKEKTMPQIVISA